MPKSIYGARQVGGTSSSADMKLVAEKINSVNSRMASIISQMTEEGANEKKASIQERVDLLRKMIHTMK